MDISLNSIIGASSALRAVIRMALALANNPWSVLITGPTGCGKTLIARLIHDKSPRRQNAFTEINIGAIAMTLLESELFGHVCGAFSGALKDRIGLLEAAGDGTIFLDEIAELPLAAQVKLLLVLEDRGFRPVGGNETRFIRARIITATNQDLKKESAAGAFRRDLFFRLSCFHIQVPSLAQRREDIPLLVEHFRTQEAGQLQRAPLAVHPEVLRSMETYPFEGNIRELQQMIRWAYVMTKHDVLSLEDFPDLCQAPTAGRQGSDSYIDALSRLVDEMWSRGMPFATAIEAVRRAYSCKAVRESSSDSEAADRLDIAKSTMSSHLKDIARGGCPLASTFQCKLCSKNGTIEGK